MAVTRADLGRRVVVRRRLPGERGPSGGPAYSDVIGILVEFDDEHLVVRRKDDTSVCIAQEHVVAAKMVPPPPQRRHPRNHHRTEET